MNSDFLDPINAKGMPDLADSAFAMDFLITVKTGARYLAVALTEATTPQLRTALRNQLDTALTLHAEITELMIKNKWLFPYNVEEQVKLDMKSAKTAVQIAGFKLFPEDTDRLGTFATPNN